jgi:threonine/homoserine/homoserine lactone efflux protein
MVFITGFLMGAAYVLPPGPVTVETVRRSLLGGLRPALAVQFGAVAGRLIWAVLGIGGLGRVLGHADARFWLGLLGAALLIFLGSTALRDGLRAGSTLRVAHDHRRDPGSRALWRPVAAGFALALVNPYAVMFWLSVGRTLDRSATALGGFVLGSLGASVLTALAVGQVQTQRAQRLARWVWSGCGGLLVVLGVQLGYTTLAAL